MTQNIKILPLLLRIRKCQGLDDLWARNKDRDQMHTDFSQSKCPSSLAVYNTDELSFLFSQKLLFSFFEGEAYPVISAQGYTWLCIQESLPVVLERPYGMPGLDPMLTACRANALPVELWYRHLLPPSSPLYWLILPLLLLSEAFTVPWEEDPFFRFDLNSLPR